MPIRLFESPDPQPVWRRESIRALEARWQPACTTPLMDLAGLATARLAMALAPHAKTVWIAAGPGNNGGDALEAAVHLKRWGKQVQACLLGEPLKLPPDALRAFERATAAGVPIHTSLPQTPPPLSREDLCIDGLLGIGANRAPTAPMLQVIGWLGAGQATVLALDVPSGLDADSGQPLGGSPDRMVRADHTLTLLGAKPGLLMGHGRDASGTLWLDTLGLPAEACTWLAPDALINQAPPPLSRPHASHKGQRGDVAVVGGEANRAGSGMSGAAILAARAALHGGGGRVMLSLLGKSGQNLPADLMLRAFDDLDLPRLTVVAGCGGGQAIGPALARLLQLSARLVLDADALNRIAEDPWLQQLLARRTQRQQATVLTPHPLEAARLLGTQTEVVQANRLDAARTLAHRFGCCVILKGSGTIIAMPGHTPRINPTGNGLLATGGTGDVLAGLLGARMAAAGAQTWAAACNAVWTHGQAADQWPSDQALSASRLAGRLR